MDTVSSSTDKSLQQNPAVRRRQMRQKVLNRIRKVNIKNKGAKSFYYFTYETAETTKRNQSAASTYFFNGEPCEGDEQFLRQMKRSVFVSNIAPGTKKSEIKQQLFDRFGKIGAIELKTAKDNKTIVGRQHISPYSPIVAIVKFSKKEEAAKACESQDGRFPARLVEQTYQFDKENCVRVDNVEPKVTKAELWEHFKSFGVVLNILLETNDGSLILTDKEYENIQSYICCYVRFSRRSEAKAAKEMNGTLFRNRKLRVELAYQKHCDPNKMSNNVLRMFFQNVPGDVIALDQIPHQHMGYVCYKNPLPVETMKRLNSRVYRNKKITLEKLDIGNLVKGQKQTKSGGQDEQDPAGSMAARGGVSVDNNNANANATAAPTMKKAKMKTIQKKVGNAAGSGPSVAGPGAPMKKKMPRKNAAAGAKAKAVEKMMKTSKEEFP